MLLTAIFFGPSSSSLCTERRKRERSGSGSGQDTYDISVLLKIETLVWLGLCFTVTTLITSTKTLLNIWRSGLQYVNPGESQVSIYHMVTSHLRYEVWRASLRGNILLTTEKIPAYIQLNSLLQSYQSNLISTTVNVLT